MSTTLSLPRGAMSVRSSRFGRSATISAVVLVCIGLMALNAPAADTVFRLSSQGDFVTLPNLSIPVRSSLLVGGLAVAACLVAAVARQRAKWVGTVALSVGVLTLLTWAGAGASIPVVGLLSGTLAVAVPLIFGSLAGVISERSGITNVAIEGQLLFGAFTSAMVASATGLTGLGMIGACLAGVVVSLLLALFAIRYHIDHVIVGVVLITLVTGMTGFFYTQVLGPGSELWNTPPRLERISIPGLSSIPVVGPVLFQQTIIVYLVILAVPLVTYGLFRTRWGLRLRAVGEHPKAADTVGVRVNLTRYLATSLAGAIAGLGGAYFTLGNVGAFNKEMTAGAGFIALAAVIFGRWHPVRAALAGLLFGFVTNLQSTLSVIGSPLPSEFLLMAPYVVTIVAVSGFVGDSRPPAAAGKAYIQD